MNSVNFINFELHRRNTDITIQPFVTMALTAILCTFVCLYDRGHDFCMAAYAGLQTKRILFLKNRDALSYCYHKAVGETFCSLQSCHFCYSKGSKIASFQRSWDILAITKSI